MVYFWIMSSRKRYNIKGGVLWKADPGTELGVQRIIGRTPVEEEGFHTSGSGYSVLLHIKRKQMQLGR